MLASPNINPDTPIPYAPCPTPLRQTVRDAWDKLGLMIGISLTWALLLTGALSLERLVPRAAPPLLHWLVLFTALTLLLPGLLAGAFHAAHLIAMHDEVTYADFWHGVRHLYKPALGLTVCDLGIVGTLGVNIGFYHTLGHWGGTAAMLLCLYLLLFWGMMAVYHFPLLIAQQAGVFDEPDHPARRGTVAVLRRAFFLSLSRPFAALGLLAVVLLISIVFTLTGVLFAVLWPGVIALLTTHATRAQLVRLGVLSLPPVAEPVPDEKFRIRLRQD